MKTKHPIKIDALRSHEPAGGILEEIDPLTKGKIHIQTIQDRLEQTYACVDEVRRYLGLSDRHRPEQCCIVTRTNAELVPIRIALDRAHIPCSIVGAQAVPNLTRVKEVHQWLEYLKKNSGKLLGGEATFKRLRKQLGADFLELPVGRILEQVGAEFYGETGQNEVLCEDILDFFYDALFEYRRRGIVGSGVTLTTAHKVKGLEFENVIILDGQWSEGCRNIDQLEEARRLYYVAVTRAKKSLTLFSLQSSNNRFIGEIPDALIQRTEAQVNIEDPTLLENHYDLINLDALYISYAAFFGAASPQTRALQRAQIGDLVQFESEASKDGSTTHVFLTDKKGIKLARLSKQGAEKWLPCLDQIKEARISCMHTRLREDNQGDNAKAKASWLIPITEILWRADG